MANYNFFNDCQMTTNKHTNNPERKLWRAVLNQALEDGFGLYTTFMTNYEVENAKEFVNKRTQYFNDICERADVDADLAWKRIQKFKLIKGGILKPGNAREKLAFELFQMIKNHRRSLHTRRKKNVKVNLS